MADLDAKLKHLMTPQWIQDFDYVWYEQATRSKLDYAMLCGVLLALLDYSIKQGISKRMTYDDVTYIMRELFEHVANRGDNNAH